MKGVSNTDFVDLMLKYAEIIGEEDLIITKNKINNRLLNDSIFKDYVIYFSGRIYV